MILSAYDLWGRVEPRNVISDSTVHLRFILSAGILGGVAKMMILYASFALDGPLTARSKTPPALPIMQGVFLLCEMGFVEHGEAGFVVFTMPGAV